MWCLIILITLEEWEQGLYWENSGAKKLGLLGPNLADWDLGKQSLPQPSGFQLGFFFKVCNRFFKRSCKDL